MKMSDMAKALPHTRTAQLTKALGKWARNGATAPTRPKMVSNTLAYGVTTKSTVKVNSGAPMARRLRVAGSVMS
jgi:hypothetical protein